MEGLELPSKIKRNRRGISPVISSIILAATVITIGGTVWSFTQSATTVIAEDYVDGVMSLMNEGTERFVIEHVSYYTPNNTLQVWIYNYGDNDITVDVYVNVIGGFFESKMENNVSSKAIIKVPISITIASGSEVAIKAASRRGNNAYYTYLKT